MSVDHSEVSTVRLPRRCAQCSVRHKAMCSAIDVGRIGALDRIVTHIQMRSGQTVFDESDDARYVYNISRGHVRLFKLLQDGRRQITGFLNPGDFLGLAARKTYAYSAEAITDTDLCRFKVNELEDLLDEIPAIRERLYEIANDELAAAQEQMLCLGRKTAKERVASFLVGQLRHGTDCGDEGAAFELPMSRSDIADYLGLTIETVSRTFTTLREEGLIELPSTHKVSIPNIAALEESTEA
ncbi:MAG: helix-turn-helix domain-containing protein [Alphaproteobacteria bacterium]